MALSEKNYKKLYYDKNYEDTNTDTDTNFACIDIS